MKKLFLAGAAIAALTGAASAADLSARPAYKVSPPVVAPAYNWSGFYVGGTIGGGMASLPLHDLDAFDAGLDPGLTFKSAGFVYGGHIGWNWQLGSTFLVGIEADINGSTFKNDDKACGGSLHICDIFADTFLYRSKLDWWGSVRARFGLVAGATLVYVTAGPAFGHINASYREFENEVGTLEFQAADSSVHWGIAAGAGVEYAFTPSWIFRAEYLYLDFSTKNFPVVTLPNCDEECGGNFRFSSTATAHIGRIGLSYKFGWGKEPTPVIARY